MKKQYDFSKLKELKNPHAGKQKTPSVIFCSAGLQPGIPVDLLEPAGCGLFQKTGG